MGRINNLISNVENPKKGFSAYYSPFSIVVYKDGTKIGEVACEEDIACFTGDDDWWFGDGSTFGK